MTFKKLAKLITEREGKKSEVNIAQVSEILKVLKSFEAFDVMEALEWQLNVEVVSAKRKKKK